MVTQAQASNVTLAATHNTCTVAWEDVNGKTIKDENEEMWRQKKEGGVAHGQRKRKGIKGVEERQEEGGGRRRRAYASLSCKGIESKEENNKERQHT